MQKNMLGIRTVTAMILDSSATDKTVQVTALKGTRHSVHYRITTQLTKSRQNQTRQRPPPAAALQFSPLPLPRQAEPKQKSQHEKTGNQTVRRTEKGKIKSVLHIASHN